MGEEESSFKWKRDVGRSGFGVDCSKSFTGDGSRQRGPKGGMLFLGLHLFLSYKSLLKYYPIRDDVPI